MNKFPSAPDVDRLPGRLAACAYLAKKNDEAFQVFYHRILLALAGLSCLAFASIVASVLQ